MASMSEREESWLLAVFIFSVMIAIGVGMTSCIRRNWQFEDACRRAGGVQMDASHVSGAGMTNTNICAKVVQPPIAQPIPLPDYRK